MKIRYLLPATLVLSASLTSGAAAQSDWEFTIAPYGWMAGIEGDLGTVPGFPSAPVDLSFGDILEDLDYGFFLFASARNGSWVIFLDGSAVKTTSTESIAGAAIDKVTIESTTTNLGLAVGYTVFADPNSIVDVYAGARFWWLDNAFEVKSQPATGLGTVKRDSDATWADPMIGVSGRHTFNDRWSVFGSADIGGFGVGSEFAWSAQLGAEYAVTETFGLVAGWRHMSVDYEDDGFVFDVDQSGPLIGATFRF